MRRAFFSAALALAGCSSGLDATGAPVVYGSVDDRIEVYEAPAGPIRAEAETSVAMQLAATSLDETDPSHVRITYGATLMTDSGTCADVRFASQIDPGECSGTLIDAQHVLTAGHCVSDAVDCDGVTWPWVFGFYYTDASTLRPLTHDDVYRCVAVTAFANATHDYAVIELDRPVVGHAPAAISHAAPVVGTSVTLVGHPSGLPMKIAGGAQLRSVTGPTLLADVDAFAGNSGSGVLDDTGAIVGILVSGNTDFVRRGGCKVVNVIDPVSAGDGEDLTPVSVAIDAYCASAGVRSPVCCPGMGCADGGPLDVDAGIDASVVADAGRDGGSADASDPRDAPMADAAIGTDGGTPPSSSSGCGCDAIGGASHARSIAMAFGALLLLGRVSRRRRHAAR